jgi:ABC-type uncharacterized transport system ATPase subunit
VLILVEGRAAALERLDALRERQARATQLSIELEHDPAPARALLDGGGFTCAPGAGRVLLVQAPDGQALRALESLRAAGHAVRSFELQRPTLEEIFLNVVRAERPAPGPAPGPQSEPQHPEPARDIP